MVKPRKGEMHGNYEMINWLMRKTVYNIVCMWWSALFSQQIILKYEFATLLLTQKILDSCHNQTALRNFYFLDRLYAFSIPIA